MLSRFLSDRRQPSLSAALLGGALLLGGCAAAKQPALTFYDFGPLRNPASATPGAPAAVSSLPAPANAQNLPAVALADVDAPPGLDSPVMYYRLDYANDQEPRPYSGSRWTSPPADLFAQRLKWRFGQSGAPILSANDGAVNVPVLRIETDEFMQRFASTTASSGRVTLRVAVLRDRRLVGQKSFSAEVVAASADAPGGVRALADASDIAITDIMSWLASLPLQK
jgi:cholesterol transport system auxiliary component